MANLVIICQFEVVPSFCVSISQLSNQIETYLAWFILIFAFLQRERIFWKVDILCFDILGDLKNGLKRDVIQHILQDVSMMLQ